MKAVTVHAPGDLRVEEVDAPEPAPGEVLVRIVYGGICGSDLHYAADGRNGAYVVTEPLVLGHEVVGVVDRAGPDTPAAPPAGTRVAVHPATPCAPAGAATPTGLHLRPGGTYLGSASTHPHTQGGFTGLLAVGVERLRELPAALPLRRAVLAEPLAVALHAVGRLEGRVAGARVLVSGAGPIGVLAVAALKRAGAAHVTAADLQELPLRVATAVGADEVVDLSRGGSLPEAGFDVVVEAAGVVPSLLAAIRAVRPGGSILQLGILPAGPQPVPVGELLSKEVALFGTQRFDTELDAAVELLAADDSLDAVVTDVFGIEDAAAAFARARDSANSSKTVLRITPDPDDA
ncbi:threonine dehydrogenase-like Zn-dependent dehydrogenase [Kineococcus radiotolerans]|uniref:Threonine dehydrogenase-like Zn-dependent dehydrogenase n=1 Tax=Kineococcus radiotolerans TaxID=131568 RepID=A0A7W4TKC9_KINRA|nr:L-idonate 5-dehydrogenase [Kineococcus radiotolerans]MBB2900503.1 threonine dehydrogenase-like Zn-dependent dehydrogenase [Kineococcus radiotolerans]